MKVFEGGSVYIYIYIYIYIWFEIKILKWKDIDFQISQESKYFFILKLMPFERSPKA